MQNQVSVELLHSKRTELMTERKAFLAKIDHDISSIEVAIELLSGLKVWETEPEILFDDENHNYIKSSIED